MQGTNTRLTKHRLAQKSEPPLILPGRLTMLGPCAPLSAFSTAFRKLSASISGNELRERGTLFKNTRVLQEWIHLYNGSARDRRDELMRHDNRMSAVFSWGHTHRKNWLFRHDPRNSFNEGDLQSPKLPPLPPPEESVYTKTASSNL